MPFTLNLSAEGGLQRELQLVVTDYRNTPLTINQVEALAAARQMVFELSPELSWPVQLYLGNPQAQAPGYDLATLLPTKLDSKPIRLRTEGMYLEQNPDYRAEPKPLTERWPWLVYVVLGGASLTLLCLLLGLVRVTTPPT